MAGEIRDMADYAGDLVSHAYDSLKGKLGIGSPSSKPPYTSQPAGTVASGRVGNDFDNRIDAAVKEAGG